MSHEHSYFHPHFDTDAGGNCRAPGCAFNSDDDHYYREGCGEDVYGYVPELSDTERAERDAELKKWGMC